VCLGEFVPSVDPVMLGATTGATIGAGSAIAADIQADKNQDILNEAIETKYNADLEVQKNQYYAQQFQATDKASQELRKSTAQEFQQVRQVMRDQSHNEAAMSSLNIVGATASRQAGVRDMEMNGMRQAFNNQREGIQQNYQADMYVNDAQYNNGIIMAEANAKASWKQIANPWWASMLGIASGTLQGAAAGAALGQSLKGYSASPGGSSGGSSGDSSGGSSGGSSGEY